MKDAMRFKFNGSFVIERSDVLDYFDSEGIEYDPDTVEITTEDYAAAANWYAETSILEFDDIVPIS